MADYAVITREKMASEYDGTKRVSLKINEDLQNGSVVVVGDLVSGKREVFATTKPTASTALTDIAILTTPEVDADERKKNLSDFINKADILLPATGDYLTAKDIFSLTAEGFDGTPAVGKIVELQAGYKLKVVATATAGSTVIGKIVDFTNGKYAVKVNG
ncbi:hypothetical protein [Konateibacter massiliensis]|uniref:hypothetical protein n=1 Tax=Konateibacter massiliensis TaxID=2002841 RepID=UPI000C151FDF|nr:hypothetical protein [Konateibacter massiliensis]